ncbi:MAG: inorganic phosphate transporter [Phycisphaeraceae bacterium]
MPTIAFLDAFQGLSTEALVLLGVTLAFGFYMAWNIGANDVANAMGTSVGSGALTLKWAIILAAVFEFAGAFLVGSQVSDTIRKGIFDPEMVESAHVLALGMIAALLAAGVWLQSASYFGWPVSTTHSIVGAVVGFGCVQVGVTNVDWGVVGSIAASWVVSPLLAATISYLLFKLLLRLVFYKPDPVEAAKQVTPYLVFVVVTVLAGVTGVKGLKAFWKTVEFQDEMLAWNHPVALTITAVAAVVVGLIGALIGWRLVRRVQPPDGDAAHRFENVYVNRSLDKATKHLQRVVANAAPEVAAEAQGVLTRVHHLTEVAERKTDPEATRSVYDKVERIFIVLQVLSACFVAFAHGANDVANAIGPMSAAVQAITSGMVAAKAAVPYWALLLGGAGIVLGLAMWGWRVMETIGRRITELTPSRGFTAEFGAAMTVLVASLMKLPISTTHTLVGAVLGVGAARGIGALNMRTVRDIVASWVITIPIGAGLSILFFYMLLAIFG